MNFYSIGEKLTDIIKNSFDVNLTELLINVIATIILILIVRFFFWNKVTAFLDQKKKAIKDEYQERDNIKDEAIKMKKEAEQELSDAKTKSNAIYSKAVNDAYLESEKIIADAKNEAQEIVSESKEKALKEKEAIIKDAKDEVIEIASLMASKIINDEIDHEKYNNKLLDELEDESK